MMQPVKASLLLATACLGAANCALAAEPAPKPRLRPDMSVTSVAAVPLPRLRPNLVTPAVAIPLPQPRPELKPADPPPEPQQKPEAPPRGGWPAEAVADGRTQCKALLAGRDVTYRNLDPIGDAGGCGAPAPIEITAIGGVTLTPPVTETCAMAAALAAWISDDVQPAAGKRLGTKVTEIRTATSYSCRRRNNASSGKMSEHSKANALDMSGFTFAKTEGVTVGGSGNWGQGLLGPVGLSKGGSFLEDVRKAACTHFTTVLGPGSDPYHGDHFHVDVLQRKGGYRICQ